MDSTPIKELFEELYSLLEAIDAQNTAILRFLKDQGIASEEKLAPYLEEAGNTSSVKWRAARVRMQHFFAPPPGRATDEVSRPKKSEPQKSEPAQAKASATTESKTEPKGSNDTGHDPANRDSDAQAPPRTAKKANPR